MPSRRDMIALTEDEQREFIEARRTLQVASIGHNGWPHIVAMWYGVIDGLIHFTTYAKAQKVLNLDRDPRITCMLEEGEEYSELRGLVIEGEAEIVRDNPDLVMAVQDASAVLRGGGSPTSAMPDAGRLKQASKRAVVKVHPTRLYSWDHTKLGGVY